MIVMKNIYTKNIKTGDKQIVSRLYNILKW